jgi:hypothetical protein
MKWYGYDHRDILLPHPTACDPVTTSVFVIGDLHYDLHPLAFGSGQNLTTVRYFDVIIPIDLAEHAFRYAV